FNGGFYSEHDNEEWFQGFGVNIEGGYAVSDLLNPAIIADGSFFRIYRSTQFSIADFGLMIGNSFRVADFIDVGLFAGPSLAYIIQSKDTRGIHTMEIIEDSEYFGWGFSMFPKISFSTDNNGDGGFHLTVIYKYFYLPNIKVVNIGGFAKEGDELTFSVSSLLLEAGVEFKL
ncbi:MAG: hypothetical protein ACOC3T_04560, partial [Bacteroidota bacterium]